MRHRRGARRERWGNDVGGSFVSFSVTLLEAGVGFGFSGFSCLSANALVATIRVVYRQELHSVVNRLVHARNEMLV